MLSVLLWIVIGGIIGWVASRIMETDAQQGPLLDIVVGIVGAAIAGFVLSPMFGLPALNQNVFHIGSLLLSLLGAIILLAIVNLFRRSRIG